MFTASSFTPPRWLRSNHLQTIVPNQLRRHPAGRALAQRSEPIVIGTPDDDRLQLYWSSNGSSAPAVLVVLHGLTGCAEAENVLSVAAKGHLAGFDVVRVDLRNSLGDNPSIGVGHAGRSEDLRVVVDHARERSPGAPIAVIGFSLGGNITLKALGEYGNEAPTELRAAAVISVPIDLDDACRAIDGSGNWIYRNYFLRRLTWRYETRRQAHPDLLPDLDLAPISSIREWDNAVVAPLSGFADAEDYYARCSSLRVLEEIRAPSLVVQAQDDPFIPFAPFSRAEVRTNDYLELMAPPRGGHVGFFAATSNGDPDRFWAENRALEFCAARLGLSWPPARGLDSIVEAET